MSANPSYTQQVFQDISKLYFPYSMYHSTEEAQQEAQRQYTQDESESSDVKSARRTRSFFRDVLINQDPMTFVPDTYYTFTYDNSAYLSHGGQFLYTADYRNSSELTLRRNLLKLWAKHKDQKREPLISPLLEYFEKKLAEPSKEYLQGHVKMPQPRGDPSRQLYNKASFKAWAGLYRNTRDEFSKLVYYVPADYMKFCSENHEAFNQCLGVHLTEEQAEDHELPEQCRSLYEDVNLSCGLRRMQVVNRVLSNFDSQFQTPSFNIVDYY